MASLDTMTTPDTSVHSDQLSSIDRNSSKKAASTWEHARDPRDGEPTRDGKALIFYCKYCLEYRCKSTTSARNHLQSIHKIAIVTKKRPIKALSDQAIDEIYLDTGIMKSISAEQCDIFKAILDKQLISEAIVRLIIKHDLSFRTVEWPAFYALLKIVNPAIDTEVISSHRSISDAVRNSWLTSKDLLRKRLQSSLSKIHFAADIWTSPNRHLFLGICVHFVDRETQQLTRALIGLRPILSHRGDEQAETIYSVFNNFGIVAPKVGYFIGDNHPSNDVLCRELAAKFECESEPISWNPIQHRLRYTGHILNLTIQVFLFEDKNGVEVEAEDNVEVDDKKRQTQWRKKGALGKLHNIAVHIRGSPTRSLEFETLVQRGLPLDNETRWNSWYTMLVVALKIESAIDIYSKKWRDDLKDDYLSPLDWESLKETSAFLQPFHRATLETQGKHGTIDRILWTMDILVQHYEQSRVSSSKPQMRANILKSWRVFDKYFAKTVDAPVYAAALILHPSRRVHYITQNWRKEWQQPAFDSVKALWMSYRDCDHTVLAPSFSPVETLTRELDIFDTIAKNYEVKQSNQDEYELYIQESVTPITGSALDWWLADERRKAWPRLSQLAIDILSIPAMSDEPERVFSGARRTISWDRMQLGVENIEKTQCLKSWLKSGLVSETEIVSQPSSVAD